MPHPQNPNISCSTCPFWGGEKVDIKVRIGGVHQAAIVSTCRNGRPHMIVGEAEPPAKLKSQFLSQIEVLGNRWTTSDYWCGDHPLMRPVEMAEAMEKQPKATGVTFGKATLENEGNDAHNRLG